MTLFKDQKNYGLIKEIEICPVLKIIIFLFSRKASNFQHIPLLQNIFFSFHFATANVQMQGVSLSTEQ